MRIASRNRFARLVIKRGRYNATTITKQEISVVKTYQTVKIFKPATRAGLSYEFPDIAGSAL
jgi:hypothetical protein